MINLKIPVVRVRNLEHKVQVPSGQSSRLSSARWRAVRIGAAGKGPRRLICRSPQAEESALTLRRTGIAALLVSISLGMASNVLFLAAFQFQFDRFFEPTLIVASGATLAELLRWAAVLDLFGYYLATAVLAYVLWQQLRPVIHSSLTCRPWPPSATRWPVG